MHRLGAGGSGSRGARRGHEKRGGAAEAFAVSRSRRRFPAVFFERRVRKKKNAPSKLAFVTYAFVTTLVTGAFFFFLARLIVRSNL